MLESRDPRALAIFLLTIAGQRDETDVVQDRLLTHALGNLVAVQNRQSDIDQQHIRLERFDRLQGRRPVVDDFHFMAELLQQNVRR